MVTVCYKTCEFCGKKISRYFPIEWRRNHLISVFDDGWEVCEKCDKEIKQFFEKMKCKQQLERKEN